MGSGLTKTRVSFTSVFCVSKTTSSHMAPHFMCVCFPAAKWDIFKESDLTGAETPVDEGTIKCVAPVSHAEQLIRYWGKTGDTVLSETV